MIAWISCKHSSARRSMGRHNLVLILTESGPTAHPSKRSSHVRARIEEAAALGQLECLPSISEALLPGLRGPSSDVSQYHAQAMRGRSGVRRLAALILSTAPMCTQAAPRGVLCMSRIQSRDEQVYKSLSRSIGPIDLHIFASYPRC
jgi:hypothetical protein